MQTNRTRPNFQHFLALVIWQAIFAGFGSKLAEFGPGRFYPRRIPTSLLSPATPCAAVRCGRILALPGLFGRQKTAVRAADGGKQ
jgi:hypothetical protein